MRVTDEQARCKKGGIPIGNGFHFRKCSRAAVIDGYCKQHHPDTVQARRDASFKAYERKRERDPLNVALNQLAGARAERDALRANADALAKAVKALLVENRRVSIYADDKWRVARRRVEDALAAWREGK